MFLLYDNPLAYYPGRARLILVEKQVPFKVREVNLFNGDSLLPAYLKVNPAGTVPTLADAADGRIISTQSRGIVEHVDAAGGAPLGGGAVDRALCKRWMDRIDTWDGNLYAAGNMGSAAKLLSSLTAYKIKFAEARAKEHPDLADTYNAKIASMKAADQEGRDPEAIRANLSLLNEILDEADAQLGKTRYLAGEEYSAADVLMTPLLFRTGMTGQTKQLLEPRPRVSDYWARLKARPSYHRVFGPALSGATAARAIVPAIAKAWWAGVVGRY